MAYIVLVAVTVIGLFTVSFCSHCTTEQVTLCQNARNKALQELNVTNIGNTPLYTLTEPQLRSYCSYYITDIKQCYQDLRQHCNDAIKANFLGYEQAIEFLCVEDFEGYLNVKACMTLNATLTGLYICTLQFNQKITAIQPHSHDATIEKCSAIKELIDCEADALRVTCGKDHEQWVRTFNSKMYQPELDYLQCDPVMTTAEQPEEPEQTGDTPVWIFGAIAGGVLVFVLLIIVTTLCLCKYMRKDQGPPQQDRNAHIQHIVVNIPASDRPPPYNSHRPHHHSRKYSHTKSTHSSDITSYRYAPSPHIHMPAPALHGHTPAPHLHRHTPAPSLHRQPLSPNIQDDYLTPAVRYTRTPQHSVEEMLPNVKDNDYTSLQKENVYEELKK